MRKAAKEYGVSAYVMESIISCESGWNPSIQSRHTYSATNVPRGYKVGDREQSFGLVQIHAPAHPHVSREQATDPEFAIDFLARNIAVGRASMWSCYNQLALR